VRKLAIAAVSLALIAAACSSPQDEEVATVDGTVLTVGDISRLFTTEAIPIDNGFRLAAFRLVALDVLERAYLEDFGGAIDPAEVDEIYQGFLTDLAAQGVTIEQAVGIPSAGEAMIEFDARLTVIRDGVVPELVTAPDLVEALQGTVEADPAQLPIVCARHVLVTTEGEAEDVIGRLEAGEDFAAVADEVSQDASPGGDLGCSSPSLYVEPFAVATMTAEIGEITGPVETNFGFHVLIVDERVTPTAEEIAADPAAFLNDEQVQSLWVDWINGELAQSDISVNEKFGFWNEDTLRIDPPLSTE
jgi:parvulin-like peptidyl-prolyl isomerase